MAFMTSNPDRRFTMEELSAKYDISVSALKQCFKGVYGTAILYLYAELSDGFSSLPSRTDGRANYGYCR